jgi:hypothetical protein
MFEQENSLPGAKLKPSMRNRNHFARSRQNHSDMRGRVVRPLGGVDKVIGVFRHEPFEILFEINAGGAISILENHKTGTGVLDENGGGTSGDSAFGDSGMNLSGDLVRSLAFGSDLERFGIRRHHSGLAREWSFINRTQGGAAHQACMSPEAARTGILRGEDRHYPQHSWRARRDWPFAVRY